MATITEDYVSFETAKLLKEKGFDAPCFAYYYVMSHKTVIAYDTDFPKNSDLCLIYANMEFGSLPTFQTAMKWLREKYNIHIEPRYFPTPNIYRYVIIHSPVTIENIDSHPQYFDTYEQACEEAIKYCLKNLI